MSVRTIRHYAAGIASRIQPVRPIWVKVNTYAHVPKADPDGSRCMVSVGDIRRRRTRMTPPRGSGKVERVYQVDLLLYATHDDTEKGGDAFDTLIENLESVFTTAPGMPTLLDPVTAQSSVVTYTGETVDLHLLASEVTAMGAKVIFRALMTVEIREILTA